MNPPRLSLLLPALLLWSVAAHAAPAMTAGYLRCESAVNPRGVDTARPRLSWEVTSPRRGAVQTAYQILVASSPERLARNDGDCWDSGKVVSSETTHIVYAGRAPLTSETLSWKVKVWDGDGRASGWSEPAWWTAGVMTPVDWKASWIQAGDGMVAPGRGLPVFRRSFAVPKRLRQAVVHVCGLGQFELFLDGRKVGDHFLDPAWSVYEKTAYYVTFDVTAALRHPGPHVFGVMLGKGFYNTAGDRRVHGVNAARPLKLILQARLRFEDGSEELVVSDGSWKTAEGPVLHSAILGGEDHDARRLPAAWAEPTFADEKWEAVRLTEGPGGALVAALSPPMKVSAVFEPVQIDEPEPGIFVYVFGQNASAVPRLRVRGPAGATVRLTPAEQRHGMSPRRNDGRGLVNPAGVGHPNHFEYTLRGGDSETWTPQFSYSGFQYLQVTGAVPAGRPNPAGLPVIERLESLHVRNAAPAVGSFECSKHLFNRIDRIIDWAVRSNLGHVLTDCPHREKLGWLEVAYLMGPSIAGRYDLARFYAKVARDIADSQAADGLVPTVAPAYPKFEAGFAYTPEWGAAAVVVPWQVYEWYGDRGELQRHLPLMRGFVDYLERTSTDLVPRAGLGDWYDYGHGQPAGASQFTPPELSAMATFARCAALVEATEGVVSGKTQTPQPSRSRRVADAFVRRWLTETNAFENQGSPQTANSMALVAGVVRDPALEARLVDRVVEDIRARGNQQTAGDVGHWYLLRALAEHGRSDVIYDCVARTNLGSYGFIVNNGWTSMPEAWDANTGASMNHCMLGHIQEWFLGWVAGLRIEPVRLADGEAFVIEPWPVGDLTWAKGAYRSPRGRLTSQWTLEDGVFELRISVPANTRAVVRPPVPVGAGVRERGRPIARSREVRDLGTTVRGRPEFLVPGGDYVFTVNLP